MSHFRCVRLNKQAAKFQVPPTLVGFHPSVMEVGIAVSSSSGLKQVVALIFKQY